MLPGTLTSGYTVHQGWGLAPEAGRAVFGERNDLLLLADRCLILRVALAFGNLIKGPSQPT